MSALPLNLKILADDRHNVTYRRSFARITGSVLGAILLQQVLFRFDANGGEKFYKFMQPCSHPKYQEDDSWTEELEFTRYELAAALKAIGTKSTSGANKNELMAVTEPTFDEKGVMTNSANLVIYWTDSSRVTWFWLNVSLLGNAVTQHYLGNSVKQNYKVIPQSSNTYVKPDSNITSKTENTKDSNSFAGEQQTEPVKKLDTPVPTAVQQAKKVVDDIGDKPIAPEKPPRKAHPNEPYRNALLKCWNMTPETVTGSGDKTYWIAAADFAKIRFPLDWIPDYHKWCVSKKWDNFTVMAMGKHAGEYKVERELKESKSPGQPANIHPALAGVKLVTA